MEVEVINSAVRLNAAHTPLKPRGVYGLPVMLGNSHSETRGKGEVGVFLLCALPLRSIMLRKHLVSKVPYSTLILLNAGRETGITYERRKS